jgi:hypothetical protein
MLVQQISRFGSATVHPFKLAFLGLFCLAAGCGDAASGGGASGSGSRPSGAEVGYLVGGAFGIQFETSTVSGVVDEHGAFLYEPGQIVRFRLGDVLLGEAEGANLLSPFDLAGIEPITNGLKGVEDAGRAFNHLTALVVLFQTFDYDGDPMNGSEITADVAALFEGVELRLEKRPSWFRADRGFREALNRANSEFLLADHRAPRGHASALNRLYEELGLQTGYYATSVYERDDGNDRTIDRRSEVEFDPDGFPTRVLSASTVDGDHETVTDFTSWGALESIAVDVGADGSIESRSTFAFDRDGNRTREESDSDGDGRLDSVVEYVHDELGRVLIRRDDHDADGISDSTTRWSYNDAEGSSTNRDDDDGDGLIDRITVWYYTAHQRVARLERDHDADGSIDSVTRYQYDDRGNQIQYWYDDNGDGVVDSARRWEYDGDGRLLRYEEDNDGDGIPLHVETTRYDAQGRKISVEKDEDADGTIDEIATYEYYEGEMLPSGARATKELRDNDNDGVADSEVISIYDQNDFLIVETHDHDADSVTDQVIRRSPVMVGWGYFFYQ